MPAGAPCSLARNRLQSAIRDYFARDGFIEIDPAGMQASPGNEAHLHGFETRAIDTDGTARPVYLNTSPEFAMKKLLAAGETRIFSFAHVWRNRERGALHSPEFTMLEWYRAGADYVSLMDDCAALLRLAAEAAGSDDASLSRPAVRCARRARASHGLRRLQAFRRHRFIRNAPARWRNQC